MSSALLMSDMSGLANGPISYIQERPLNGVMAGSAFSGSANFGFDIASNSMMLGHKSFIVVKAEIFNVGAGPGLAQTHLGNTKTLTRNVGCSLFNNMTLQLNDQQIDNLNYPAEVLTATQMAFSCKDQDDNILSAVPALPLEQIDLTNATEGSLAEFYKFNAVSGYNVNYKNGGYLNKVNDFTIGSKKGSLCFRPPLSIFQTKSPLSGGTNVKFGFNINSNWLNSILAVGDGVAYNTITADNVYANITDLYLMRCMIGVDAPVGIPRTISVLQYKPVPHTLTSPNDTWNVNLDPGTNRLLIYFRATAVGNASNDDTHGSSSGTDLSTGLGFALNAVKNLKSLTVQWNSQNYPIKSYSLQQETETTESYDLVRAYNDFILNSSSDVDRNGPMLSMEEWDVQKMFSWQLLTGVDQRPETTCQVSCELNITNDYALTTVVVIGISKKHIEMEMDEQRKNVIKSVVTSL